MKFRKINFQLAFDFYLQENFYIVHDHIDPFWYYLLKKDFHTFNVFFFEAFLCFVL